jgi:light-harvesting protein B-800-850 alpha chain
MYNGKMWLVVRPTVGIPLFFGGVALTSLAIHTAVLANTTWYPEFYNGRGRPAAATAAAPATATAADSQAAVTAAQAALGSGQMGVSSISVNLVPR